MCVWERERIHSNPSRRHFSLTLNMLSHVWLGLRPMPSCSTATPKVVLCFVSHVLFIHHRPCTQLAGGAMMGRSRAEFARSGSSIFSRTPCCSLSWKGSEMLGNMRGTWTDAEMCSTCCKHMFDIFWYVCEGWHRVTTVFECPAVTWNLPIPSQASHRLLDGTMDTLRGERLVSAESHPAVAQLVGKQPSSQALRKPMENCSIAAGFLSMAALASSLNFQVFNRVRGLLMALQQGTSLMFWLQNCKDQYWKPILRVHQFCNLTALRPTCTAIFSFPLIAWFRDSGWLSIWGWGVKIPVTDQRVQYIVIK